MPKKVCISLDAMGGENAPYAVLTGAELSLKRYKYLYFLIFGDKDKITPIMHHCPILQKSSTIYHTTQEVTMSDKPSLALRKRRESSMRLAINALKNGDAQGVVSSGNTGALMAISKFVLKTVKSIARPAIATCIPTLRGKTVMLDLGANIECDEKNLVQFALMGEVFARILLDLKAPSVGILNVGIEELKGNDCVKKASNILREINFPISFKGFIEGDDIYKGKVDVVVTDGFTGNVALKIAEGTSKLFSYYLRESFQSSLRAKIAYLFARQSLNNLKKRIDPRMYNGAMLLGLNGITVKSHGSTDTLGFCNAIYVCHDLIYKKLNHSITNEISAFENSLSDLVSTKL